ncbi:CHAT domain-containing tetratricopeptide repeat protein [Kistimonas asteriae]|uniref:CHAT domain-containing tetratricopeptide repeat protein n=1 Tax=Kistimonas asteriae TaxID=517724 RepID=UPI001BAD7C5E|nr:CHAT domain-containing protein [Kistimonas asteriae]
MFYNFCRRVILTLSFIVALSGCDAVEQAETGVLMKAEVLFKEGHFNESFTLYEKNLDPSTLIAGIDEANYSRMAMALGMMGKGQTAVDLLQERLRLYQATAKPADKALLELTASIMFLQLMAQDPAAAIETARKLPTDVTRQGAEASRLFLILGEAWIQMGDYVHAERAYQLAMMEADDVLTKTSIINRYGTLLNETRRTRAAIDLFRQLETLSPPDREADLALYNNDRAVGLILYGKLLMERAEAKPALRAETVEKVGKLYLEAMKLVNKLPETTFFQGTKHYVNLETGKAMETMGYPDMAIELYNMMQSNLFSHSTEDPMTARVAWDVAVRHSRLTNVANNKQVQLAEARVNTYLQTFPLDSQQLLAPLADLALTQLRNGQVEQARNMVDIAITNYAKPIADYGVCFSGLENLYADDLVTLYDPKTLLRYANAILTKFLIANSRGLNVWQSNNCRMALYTILWTMEMLQDQVDDPADQDLLDSIVVLAAQIHQYGPLAHSLVMRKLKNDSVNQPYHDDFNRIVAIGERQTRLRAQLRHLLAEGFGDNQSKVENVSQEIENLALEYDRLIASIPEKYPNATPPQIPLPVSPLSLQQHLDRDDAIIIWLVEDYDALAVVITRDEVQTVPLSVSLDEIEQRVTETRASLDQPGLRSAMDIRPFAMEPAYQLYQDTFKPLQPYLKGKKNLYLLPDGPLAKLPLQILPTQLPEKAISSPLDFVRYRSVSWLGNEYLMSYQPSLSNLHTQLTSPKATSDKSKRLAYAGFGNPKMQPVKTMETWDNAFTEAGEHLQDMRQQFHASFSFMGNSTQESLSRLAPLPKTEQQLRRIGQILGEDDYIYVGKSATLAQLEQLPLSRFETLVFATHGLMAGESTPEPGLVMTPVNGDYSTAILDSSTIAGLKLDADRVILSACNTGELGEENGLASLSTAFFYAGARSLLVSHWSTEQSATTALIVKLFAELQLSPEQGLSASLQRAAHDMRDHDKNLFHAHPMFWAPFVAIGQDH